MAGMMIMHTWTLLHDLHHLVNGAAGQTSRTRRRRVDNICKVRPTPAGDFLQQKHLHELQSAIQKKAWLLLSLPSHGLGQKPDAADNEWPVQA